MKKRALSLMLALVMVLALVPSVAFAAPVVANGGGSVLFAVTDAWSPIPFTNDNLYTDYDASGMTLAFSVSIFNRDYISICMDMEDNLSLRDFRVFLNQVGVPIRNAIPGDCSYYDGKSRFELAAMDIKTIVIPTSVLTKAKKAADGFYYSSGTIEMMDNTGKVFTYNLKICADDAAPVVPVISEFPFTAKINADNVHKRGGPSVNDKILGKFALGESVTVTNIVDNWATLDYNGKVIYVHKAYLTKPYDGPIDGYLLSDVVVTTAYTVDGISLGVLPKGTAVKILAREGVSFMVEVDGMTGYIVGSYIQTW